MKTESRMKRRRPICGERANVGGCKRLDGGAGLGSCRRSILRYNGSIEQGDLRGWPLFIVLPR